MLNETAGAGEASRGASRYDLGSSTSSIAVVMMALAEVALDLQSLARTRATDIIMAALHGYRTPYIGHHGQYFLSVEVIAGDQYLGRPIRVQEAKLKEEGAT